MGIDGLLYRLKSVLEPVHLQKFRGQTVAIDAYSWLHKATYCCAMELALGKTTTKYVSSMMKKINMIQHFGVKPLLVFDGQRLPLKANTHKKRQTLREGNLALAKKYLAEAKRMTPGDLQDLKYAQAHKFFQRVANSFLNA